MKKAFHDLNRSQSGEIMPDELEFNLQHWGFYLTREQFKAFFNIMDVDGDGKISFKDF